jgi:hypothetical protein
MKGKTLFNIKGTHTFRFNSATPNVAAPPKELEVGQTIVFPFSTQSTGRAIRIHNQVLDVPRHPNCRVCTPHPTHRGICLSCWNFVIYFRTTHGRIFRQQLLDL